MILLYNRLLYKRFLLYLKRTEFDLIQTIILSSLRLLAGGSLQNDVVLGHGLSQPSFSRHFGRFLDAVIREMQGHLGWYSTPAEAQEAKEEFFKKSHIPGVMGIIDGM